MAKAFFIISVASSYTFLNDEKGHKTAMAAIHFSHLVWLLFIYFQIKMSLSVIKHYFNNFCHLGYILKNQMPLLTIFCSYTKYYHTQLINKKFSQKQYN